MAGDEAEREQVEEGGEEGEHASCEAVFFAERAFVIERLQVLAGPAATFDEGAAEAALETITKTLEKYSEQSNLLDPALQDLLELAMGRAREIVMEQEAALLQQDGQSFPFQLTKSPQLHVIFRFVYTLCRIRGYKTVRRFFPHEAAELEPVLHALQSQDRDDHHTWHTRYCLLLWLSILALVPFDICSIDSSMGEGQASLVGTLASIAKASLGDSGPTRDAAAVCLASLFRRPDMEASHLEDFLSWSTEVLTSRHQRTSIRDGFVVTGVMQALSGLFKAGHRTRLVSFIPSIFQDIVALSDAADANQTFTRKLCMKLLQRIGLTFMPPRVAKWRYHRGQRSLLQNLTVATTQGGAASASQEAGGMVVDDDEEEEEVEVPEELEEVLEQLLCGLRDKDTVVRWSAAKGIGRITGNLPKEHADEIVASVLEFFSEGETDSSWHGGCLALAELARRGLLLPARLPEVVPVVVRAILYDVRRGHSSVGSHVRDAACYVCWAFARAYSPQIMRPHVPQLCEGMLVTSLFDREINCRRAASAAFQENVGRQGHENFPHGIEILTAADYFTLGNRTRAYLSISLFVAKFARYQRPIIDHLCQVKLVHWDLAIRTLAAGALHRLTHLSPDYMATAILPWLLRHTDSPDLHRRHGCLLGIAELVLAFATYPYRLPPDLVQEVVEVVPKIEKARLYRGRGGELVRSAACRLIECMALANVPLNVKMQLRLLESIEESLRHPIEATQTKAVAALHAFTREYFPVGDKGPSERLQARIVDKYVSTLQSDDNPAVTRGLTLALGALPRKLLLPSIDPVLTVLAGHCSQTRRVGDEPDAETRRNAVQALVQVCGSLGISSSDDEQQQPSPSPPSGMSDAQLRRVFDVLLSCTDDYATDKRGDVGSWVRMAALRGLRDLSKQAVMASTLFPTLRPHRPIGAGDRVAATGYGEGVVEAVRAGGQVLQVVFGQGQMGAVCFPYGGRGMLRTETCRRVSTSSSSDGGEEEGEEEEEVMVPDQAGREAYLTAPAEAAEIRAGRKRLRGEPYQACVVHWDSGLCSRVLCAVVKQLSEKLDLVRECAGEVLCDLLSSDRPRLPSVPDRVALQVAVAPGEDSGHERVNWASPAQCFPRVVKMIALEPYHEAVVSGLIISVGGLTESVVKAATSAVQQWARVAKQLKAYAPLVRLSRTLVGMFDSHGQDERVMLALLSALDRLFTAGVLTDLGSSDEQAELSDRLVARVRAQMAGCRDVKKLLLCLHVALHLLHDDGEGEGSGGCGPLPLLMILLGHRFPRVRKATAEQLYLKLLVAEGLVPGGPQAYDAVIEKLSTTVWDAEDHAALRGVRDEICGHLGVPTPQERTKAAAGQRKDSSKEKRPDEFASYASLVKEMGY